jgi:hypothetical protein
MNDEEEASCDRGSCHRVHNSGGGDRPQDHGSCKAFGETVSGNAQSEQPWGQIVSQGAQLGLTTALTAAAHTTEGLCEPR